MSRLGRIEFPNSGSTPAQAPFLRGVALLHSFLYREAREAFQEAERIDSTFAMAYWGELMSAPSRTRIDTVERLIRGFNADSYSALTRRERDYLALAPLQMALRRATSDSVARDAQVRVIDAWRALHERYPSDDDATLFYALAVMNSRYNADAAGSLRIAVRAAALAEEVFARRPDHPGAAHYLIHIYDDARLAPLGLRAAQIYARIAPDAFHAVHMPSHIFFQFGMWDQVVRSNTEAWRLSKRNVEARVLSAGDWDYHAADWLQFGLLQTGQVKKARALADSVRALSDSVARRFGRTFALSLVSGFDTRAAMETGRDELLPPLEHALFGSELFFIARAAARQHDVAQVDAVMRRMQAVMGSVSPGPRGFGQRIMIMRIGSMRALAAGDVDSALALLRTAADSMETVPEVVLAEGPERSGVGDSYFVLGELLYDLGRFDEALGAMDHALELSPGRSIILLARARILARLNRRPEAAAAYARVMENWKNADADFPFLQEARRGARGDE